MPEPISWPRFCNTVRSLAPVCPVREEETSALATATGAASGAVTYGGAAVSGAGGSLPTGVGAVVGVADAAARGDVGDAVTAVVDELVGWAVDRAMGGLSGTFVAGLLMTLRGTHAALERSDAMTQYLLELGGYLTTLARSAQRARGEGVAAVIPPLPRTPRYIEETGALYSRFNREAFVAGYARVARLVVRMDDGYTRSGHEPPSIQCFRYLAEQGRIPGSLDDYLRSRDRSEDYIAERMLRIDRAFLRERLRRWAATG